LHQEQLDVRKAISQAVQMSMPLIESRRHQLRVEVPPEPLPAYADPSRLVQVFGNLLINAAKFTPEGGQIDVAAQQHGAEIVVRVKDTGVGIPPDKLRSIFELFTQVDNGLARSGSGLGIGLTLVRRLVELQGGQVTAHSGGAGQGSEFVVTLPASAGDPATSSASPAGPDKAAPQHILIVEDNPDGRESLATLLRLMGHQVSVAADGIAGLTLARAERPSVALIDIGLPGLDGYEVVRQLRAELGATMFLVAVSGHTQPADQQRALQAGFDAYLTKPVDVDVLHQTLSCPPTNP
jgi:CheY-like chemotaxis protein